jgi:hypothetical protein
MNTKEEYSHAKIINQCYFGQRHLIDACISSNMTLLPPGRLSTQAETPNNGLNSDGVNGDHSAIHTIKTFPTMLKLISGTLVGGVNYSEIYIDSDVEDELDLSSTNGKKTNKETDQDKKTTHPKCQHCQK